MAASDEEYEVIHYYFRQGYTLREMLNFLHHYHGVTYSISTLKRRLRDCGLSARNQSPIQDIQQAIRRELVGPGGQLGYRSLWHTLRTKHGLQVRVSYACMQTSYNAVYWGGVSMENLPGPQNRYFRFLKIYNERVLHVSSCMPPGLKPL